MKFPAFDPINLKNNIDAPSIEEIYISRINPNLNQPRKNFDSISLVELASSIKQYGVLQPILVRQIDETRYQIIAGERRWRASQIAGLTVIPSIIQKNHSEQENVAISLIENIQREELNPIELAESFYMLNKNHELSHESIASMVGKSRVTITNLLRLLNLSKDVRLLLTKGQLEMGHARALLTLEPEKQYSLAKKIIENKLTVRDTERLVRSSKQSKEKKITPYATSKVNTWLNKLPGSLSSKVEIHFNEKEEGRIVINFKSLAEVDWFFDRLEEKYEV